MNSSFEMDYSEKNFDLDHRTKEFKNDKEQMDILVLFINDILSNAKLEAERKMEIKGQQSKSSRSNSLASAFRNGRMANRARGFMIRMYDVICNCANTAKTPGQRFNLKSNNNN